MKRLSDQTLYEILEVSVEAPPEEIERAVERARAIYGPGSLATYTLMSPDEATLLNNRIDEAKQVLLDPDARSRYDERIGVRPRGSAAAPAPAPPELPVQGAATHWPPPAAPVATPVPEAAVTSSTAPAPPTTAQLQIPIVLATPIATPPPGTIPGVPPRPAAPPAAEPPAAEPAPAAPPAPPAEAAAPAAAEPPPVPPSPGTAPLAPSPAPAPVATPVATPAVVAAPPIPLKHELPAPRELLVPEGAAWTGEMLRQVRESRGLTVPQISERTKVTRHHLENIEGDRFGALPAPVYLRGILMTLSRELRLDGQKVARSYLERMAAALAAAPKK